MASISAGVLPTTNFKVVQYPIVIDAFGVMPLGVTFTKVFSPPLFQSFRASSFSTSSFKGMAGSRRVFKIL